MSSPTIAPPGVATGPEIVARRTADSKTFATGIPGQFRTEVFSQPVHIRGATGTWDDVDTNLVDRGSDRLGPRSSPLGVDLSSEATDPALARVNFDSGHSVAFSLEGARPAAGSRRKNTVTYRQVRPGVDLELSSRPAGLKEDIILAGPNTPDTFVFPLALRGLTAALDTSSGDIVYTDEAGVERARTPHGFMEDSAVDPHTGQGAQSMGVSYELVPGKDKGGVALRVRLDRAWLDDDARI